MKSLFRAKLSSGDSVLVTEDLLSELCKPFASRTLSRSELNRRISTIRELIRLPGVIMMGGYREQLGVESIALKRLDNEVRYELRPPDYVPRLLVSLKSMRDFGLDDTQRAKLEEQEKSKLESRVPWIDSIREVNPKFETGLTWKSLYDRARNKVGVLSAITKIGIGESEVLHLQSNGKQFPAIVLAVIGTCYLHVHALTNPDYFSHDRLDDILLLCSAGVLGAVFLTKDSRAICMGKEMSVSVMHFDEFMQ